ncbi:hypothetical protein GCK72_021790 [Caenorhabditis remanei]|uniref:mitogen-activated protein kinase kinase n=1 Tax=Caenorhabditis remanei TaxID=31234 RepID=A0A6A5GKV8_CAERE|nr:hypothetical protein GCK72_021790 [Caenorhabditis remanei]KAF1755221.1 hypothetical protein GCK72_021790 [Caenorhabditis remanei]
MSDKKKPDEKTEKNKPVVQEEASSNIVRPSFLALDSVTQNTVDPVVQEEVKNDIVPDTIRSSFLETDNLSVMNKNDPVDREEVKKDAVLDQEKVRSNEEPVTKKAKLSKSKLSLSEKLSKRGKKSGLITFPGTEETKIDFTEFVHVKNLGCGLTSSVDMYNYKEKTLALKKVSRVDNVQNINCFLKELKVFKRMKKEMASSKFLIESYGYFFVETNMFLVLEFMDTSLESLLARNEAIPGPVVRNFSF